MAHISVISFDFSPVHHFIYLITYHLPPITLLLLYIKRLPSVLPV